ncbi:MAG: glutathione peroxidase [Neomegalonema sp.]|nr:glutathione peroxidase [Neomegalonema sp.]
MITRRLFLRRLFLGHFIAAAALLGLSIAPVHAQDVKSAHDFTFEAIEGGPMPLSQYAGKAVLVVNTASMCGYTHQYDGLQTLWERYKDRGLVVIGAPSQDFRQEYGSADKVKDFCEVNFGLNFPMTDLVHVKGASAHPFFAWAAAQAGEPRWNFNKYLIAPDGSLLAHYNSSTKPLSQELTSAIEAVLPSS